MTGRPGQQERAVLAMVRGVLLVCFLVIVGAYGWILAGDVPGELGVAGWAEDSPGAVVTQDVSPGVAGAGGLVAMVDALPVDDSYVPVDYDRDAFGPAWSDVDHNGCDTRNDVLARDLTGVEVRPGTQGCVVERGVLHDPYTGAVTVFEKRDGGVDIDHVVPLAAAWWAGAWEWDAQARLEFANDPGNLQAVASAVNRDKSAQDPSQWLPPDPTYTCTYVQRWVQVKTTWHLTTTSEEHAVLRELAAAC